MEQYVERAKEFDTTLRARSLVGARVLAHSGKVVGKVSQVQIDPLHGHFTGVVVKRGLFKKNVYVCNTYIESISSDGIRLRIDPALLYRHRKAITKDGKVLGPVVEIIRRKNTNTIENLIIRRYFIRSYRIHAADVKLFGESVILKDTYQEWKKHAPTRQAR